MYTAIDEYTDELLVIGTLGCRPTLSGVAHSDHALCGAFGPAEIRPS
eukprot:COSAG02_NODE_554_length_20414_cov_67.356535_2_plen_47_part_00